METQDNTADGLEDQMLAINGVKLVKKKMAILMGYCGTGYCGMQNNPGVATIESELQKAFAAVGCVRPENLLNLGKVAFNRAARTDKGVHAAGQVVSLKLLLPQDGETDGVKTTVDALNQALPAQIKVWDIVRVRGNFHAKNNCQSRMYEYLLPTFMLQQADDEERKWYGQELTEDEIAHMKEIFSGQQQSQEEDLLDGQDRDQNDSDGELQVPDDLDKKCREYRISAERLEQFRNILSCYLGTHNFHNFTVGRPFWDQSSNRHMLSVTASEPFVKGQTEWVAIKLHGHSFMLHQIRKMVAFAVLAMRIGFPAQQLFDTLCGEVRVNVPKMPALGLFLDRPVYNSYNKIIAETAKQQVLMSAQPVTFEPYEEEIRKFKDQWIYEEIYKMEEEQRVYMKWLQCIKRYPTSWAYLREDGLVPKVFSDLAKLGAYNPRSTSASKKRERDIENTKKSLKYKRAD
ncbi:hypothetical protein MP228_005485 [Amoeboaphelidium protococcarum]|nr:hypothetical protein MP228_005485 [Amoeboaphelidium protococcarum]